MLLLLFCYLAQYHLISIHSTPRTPCSSCILFFLFCFSLFKKISSAWFSAHLPKTQKWYSQQCTAKECTFLQIYMPRDFLNIAFTLAVFKLFTRIVQVLEAWMKMKEVCSPGIWSECFVASMKMIWCRSGSSNYFRFYDI